MTQNQRQNVEDPGVDILSHGRRRNQVHILTLDKFLAEDVYERIHTDPRTESCKLVRPKAENVKETISEIEAMAQQTVSSRLIIIDVRKSTLPLLQQIYNKVVGYNRRDLNQLCYTLLLGDGPMNLFSAGKSIDAFVPHVAGYRTDYHPAVFFYDPFLHYEPDELPRTQQDYESKLPEKPPKRLAPYFKEKSITVGDIRKFFRAAGKPKEVKQKRLKTLTDLYKKRIEEQFPNHKDKLEKWFTKEGLQLATERLHLYPLHFEDWVSELIEKAQNKS